MIREMLISEILELPSVDSEGGPSGSSGWLTSAILRRTSLGKKGSFIRKEYDIIRAELEHDGYNRVPLHVDIGKRMGPFYNVKIPLSMLSSDFMGNGHHRLKMMIELGFKTARVTDDPSESDDTGEPNYADGYGYDDDYDE